jgi:hypothetical protein
VATDSCWTYTDMLKNSVSTDGWRESYSSPKRWSNTQFSSCSKQKVSKFLKGSRQTLLFHIYFHLISLPLSFLSKHKKTVCGAAEKGDNVKTWKHTIVTVNKAIKIYVTLQMAHIWSYTNANSIHVCVIIFVSASFSYILWLQK